MPNFRKSGLALRCAVAVWTICAVGPALGQPTEALSPRQQGGIRYLSGGIGLDEVESIGAVSRQYSTLLSFAAAGTGEYLSDVPVVIRGMDGKAIFNVVTQGPFLLVNLAPGQYRLTATYGGVEQVKDVRVPAKGQVQARFYWIIAD